MAADKSMTKEEVIQDIDIQLKQLQLEEAKLRMQDTRENIQAREDKRRMREQQCRTQAKQLQDEENMRRTRVLDCPHKKGGTDLAGFRRGTNEKFSVIRFQWPNGDYLNQCTRCGNRVLPPVEPLRVADLAEVAYLADYGFRKPEDAGYFAKSDKEGYGRALKQFTQAAKEYNEWLQMPTDNIPSTACLPTQTSGAFDWKRLYRIALHESMGIPLFAAQKYHARAAKEAAA